MFTRLASTRRAVASLSLTFAMLLSAPNLNAQSADLSLGHEDGSSLLLAAADPATPAPAQPGATAQPAPAPSAPLPGAPAIPGKLRTYEMPAITVEANGSVTDELIGPYAQPRWTAHRLFPTARAYVIPEGEVDVEYWFRAQTPQHGPTEFTHMEEVEIGLPGRFQLDFYLVQVHEGRTNDIDFNQQVELRWAVADWGKIPFNPTFYIEYANQENAPEKIETKILLADTLAPRWHWATNLVWEHECGGDRTDEFELTAGISFALLDDKFAIGAEGKFSIENDKFSRSTWAEDIRIGPSFQWRPIPSVHIDFAPLFGVTGNSSKSDIYFVIGWEF